MKPSLTLFVFALAACGVEQHEHATFTSTQAIEGDEDGDGVADREDLCPRTPSGTRALTQGCAAIDNLVHGERLLAPVHAAFEKTTRGLARDPAFITLLRSQSNASNAVNLAAVQLRDGEPCAASATYAAMTATVRQMRVDLAALRRTPVRVTLPATREPEGDSNDADTRRWAFDITDTLLQRTLDAAAQREWVVAQTCAAVVGPATFRGRITDLAGDTANVKLADGKTVHLAKSALSDVIARGVDVTLTGSGFGDGSGLATSADGAVGVTQPSADLPPCGRAAVAPVQPFDTPNPVLHEPAGYFAAGMLRLEHGMRFGRLKGPCFTPPSNDGTFKKDTLTIEMWGYVNGAGANHMVAVGLEAGDAPAPAPMFDVNKEVQISFKRIRHTCTSTPQGESCDYGAMIDKQFFWGKFVGRRGYCAASYGQTGVALEDTPPGTFVPVKLFSPVLLSVTDTDAFPTFSARGYRVVNGASSRPAEVNLSVGQAFAVYADDFYTDPTLLFPEAATGVDHAAGLEWPQVAGTRGGDPFVYACQLPQLARDVLDPCSPPPDALYRYPFAGPSFPLWQLSQGNNGAFTHNGTQAFAFDFVAPQGTPVRAARGGVVFKVVDSNVNNCFALAAGQTELAKLYSANDQCPANVITVEHSDGTFGRYLHIPYTSALVVPGQAVSRGQHLAMVGNVGFSTGPHLHFDVFNAARTSSIQVRFQTLLNTCFIPVKGDPLFSNQF